MQFVLIPTDLLTYLNIGPEKITKGHGIKVLILIVVDKHFKLHFYITFLNVNIVYIESIIYFKVILRIKMIPHYFRFL